MAGKLLTRLAVEEAGLVSGDVEVRVFLIDQFVAVDSIEQGVIPHRMVPPIEDRIFRDVIDGIAVGTSDMSFDRPARDVIHLSVSL